MSQFARYESHWVGKDGKAFFEPDSSTRLYGRLLVKKLLSLWTPPAYYTHLTPGGFVSRLHEFKRRHYFAQADISSFFPSLTKNRVARNLHLVFGDFEEAWTAAGMSCVPYKSNLILPIGFVQSPLLATLCLANSRVGKVLADVHENDRVLVQCYFDDIVLCSNSSYQLNRALSAVCQSISAAGLKLNFRKTKRARHRITVFNIECSHQRLRLTEARMNQFKTELFSTDDELSMKGILNYVGRVNGEQAEELKQSVR